MFNIFLCDLFGFPARKFTAKQEKTGTFLMTAPGMCPLMLKLLKMQLLFMLKYLTRLIIIPTMGKCSYIRRLEMVILLQKHLCI